MRRSTDKILTTHVGSLPRSPELARLMEQRDKDQITAEDLAGLPAKVIAEVGQMVDKQRRAGIDVLNDGEASKIGYATYVRNRLTGFEGKGDGISIWDLSDTPEFAAKSLAGLDPAVPACTGPIRFVGQEAIDSDIANLRAATKGGEEAGVFMNAASPGVISIYLENQHYPTEEEYLEAIAEAMRPEYESIANAGFILQIDAPDLAMGLHVGKSLMELGEFRRHLERRVEILNHACRNIPSESWRVHMCWGNYQGPHHHDVPLADIVDIILKVDAGALLFEGANPRHEHEWKVWQEIEVPEDKILIPGVLDTCTNYVEHPDLIADRILRYAERVGRERVIAGTDCGFASFASFLTVDPRIAWMKLEAMAEGAARASKKLWS